MRILKRGRILKLQNKHGIELLVEVGLEEVRSVQSFVDSFYGKT